jgi:hypothetical protein
MEIYPNPSNGTVYIHVPENESPSDWNYSIHNALGQTIQLGIIHNDERIQVDGLENGIYFVDLENAARRMTRTLIVNR